MAGVNDAVPDAQSTADTQRQTRTIFRVVAFAEAVSWGLLLVAMFFKWIVQDDPNTGLEGGVPIAGPIHGVVFIAYVVVCFVAWRQFRWTPKTLVLALACSIPPFFTAIFEVLADRRGLLGQTAAATER